MSEDKKINIKDLDLTKLIEIAKTPTKEKIRPLTDYSDAYQFVLEFGLKQGEHEVPAFLIYNLYKDWKKKESVSKVRFFTDFKQYFDKKKKNNGGFYLLNFEPTELEQVVRDKIYEQNY